MSEEHLRLLEKKTDKLEATVISLGEEINTVKVEQKGQQVQIEHLIDMVKEIHTSVTTMKVEIGKIFAVYSVVVSVFTAVATFFTLKLLE